MCFQNGRPWDFCDYTCNFIYIYFVWFLYDVDCKQDAKSLKSIQKQAKRHYSGKVYNVLPQTEHIISSLLIYFMVLV